MSNINRKPLIWSQDKIIMKFEQKKWTSFVFGKVYENCPKIKENCYFMKHTSKRVISTETTYLVPIIYNNEIWEKKWVNFLMGEVYENCPKIK